MTSDGAFIDADAGAPPTCWWCGGGYAPGDDAAAWPDVEPVAGYCAQGCWERAEEATETRRRGVRDRDREPDRWPTGRRQRAQPVERGPDGPTVPVGELRRLLAEPDGWPPRSTNFGDACDRLSHLLAAYGGKAPDHGEGEDGR